MMESEHEELSVKKEDLLLGDIELPVKKRKRKTESTNEETPVHKNRERKSGNEQSPVKQRQRKIESGIEETPVKKKDRMTELINEETPVKKRDRKTESVNEQTPVKKRDRKTESLNEETPVKKRDKRIEPLNEETPVKKRDIKTESLNEETPVKKRDKRIESLNEETPVKKRDIQTESLNEDTPVKKRDRKTESLNEETPVKKRDKRIELGNVETLAKESEKITESGNKETPVQRRKKRKISENQELLVGVNENINESELDGSVQMEEGHSEAEDVQAVRNRETQMELGDILKDIDDLNEPSCMDKILMYLEEINDEDYLFMELLVDRLHGETITWEQPWYQQSNSLSRPLKDSDNEDNPKPYRTDTICKAECDKIQENWNEFRKLYEIPDKLICLARWKNKDKSRLPHTPEEQARRFVVAYLARGLQRTIYQVFRHIMTYFGGTVKGAYSSDEEKIMKVCFMHHTNDSVTLLSRVLSREPRGIYKRLKQMFNGKPEKKKLKWTLPLATKLLVLLLKYTQCPLEDLKYRKIDKAVWLKLEKKLDQHYIYLQHFWYGSLHVQVFVKENLKVNKLRKTVFQKLKTSSYQVWTDIRWKDLVKEFPDGLTHRFLYLISRRVVCKIPEYLKKPLPEIADAALDALRTHHYRKRRLKTLRFNENGELEVVKYFSSELYDSSKINI